MFCPKSKSTAPVTSNPIAVCKKFLVSHSLERRKSVERFNTWYCDKCQMQILSNTCIQAGLRDHLHFTKGLGSFIMHYSRREPITTQKTKQTYFSFRFPYVLCLLWCVVPCCFVNKWQCVQWTCNFHLHGVTPVCLSISWSNYGCQYEMHESFSWNCVKRHYITFFIIHT
jgi:hypothetical protein